MTPPRRLPALVTPEQYEVISQAMMLMKRSWQEPGVTDGELLDAICRAWMSARGIHVKPSRED